MDPKPKTVIVIAKINLKERKVSASTIIVLKYILSFRHFDTGTQNTTLPVFNQVGPSPNESFRRNTTSRLM